MRTAHIVKDGEKWRCDVLGEVGEFLLGVMDCYDECIRFAKWADAEIVVDEMLPPVGGVV